MCTRHCRYSISLNPENKLYICCTGSSQGTDEGAEIYMADLGTGDRLEKNHCPSDYKAPLLPVLANY